MATTISIKWYKYKQQNILRVFEVADFESSAKFYEFKMGDPIWQLFGHRISIELLKKTALLYIFWYNLVSLDF